MAHYGLLCARCEGYALGGSAIFCYEPKSSFADEGELTQWARPMLVLATWVIAGLRLFLGLRWHSLAENKGLTTALLYSSRFTFTFENLDTNFLRMVIGPTSFTWGLPPTLKMYCKETQLTCIFDWVHVNFCLGSKWIIWSHKAAHWAEQHSTPIIIVCVFVYFRTLFGTCTGSVGTMLDRIVSRAHFACHNKHVHVHPDSSFVNRTVYRLVNTRRDIQLSEMTKTLV